MRTPLGSRVFRRYLAAATAVLMIALVSVAIGSVRTERLLMHNKVRESEAALAEIAGIVGNDVFRAITQAESLVLEKEFIDIAHLSKDEILPKNHIAFLSARDRLTRAQISSGLIAECAVIFSDYHMLTLTTHHIVTNLRLHYQSGLLRYEDMTYDHFVADIALRDNDMQASFALFPCRPVSISDRGVYNVITAAKQITFSGQNERAAALLMIDADAIARRISTFMPGYGGWIALTDQGGNVLYIHNETELSRDDITASLSSAEAPADGVVLTAASAHSMGFGFAVFIPNAWLKQQVSPMLSPMQLMLLLVLGIVASIAAGAVLFSGAPLTRLEFKLRGGMEVGRHPIRRLEEGVDELFDSNAELRGTIRNMLPRMTAGILERLYKGGILEDDELDLVETLKETLPPSFRVALLCWRNYPDQRDAPLPAHLNGEGVKRMFEYFEGAWVHRCDANTISFLVDTTIYDDAKLTATLSEMLGGLTDALPYLFSIAVGGRYTQINAIHTSYAEARMAMARVLDRSVERLAFFQEENRSATDYLFPFEYKDRLVAYIAGGDAVYMRSLMKQIYERNFIARRVAQDDQAAYYNDLVGILARLSAEMGLCENPPSPARLRTPSAVYEHFLSRFERVVDARQQDRSLMDQKLRDDMLRFIDENYSDSALSLRLLADKFSMTEKYVSHFFKAQNNQNFSEYVEEKRLGEATRLMENPSLPLTRVHVMVGYATSSTFYKAFRRRYGMSPSAWREGRRNGGT